MKENGKTRCPMGKVECSSTAVHSTKAASIVDCSSQNWPFTFSQTAHIIRGLFLLERLKGRDICTIKRWITRVNGWIIYLTVKGWRSYLPEKDTTAIISLGKNTDRAVIYGKKIAIIAGISCTT